MLECGLQGVTSLSLLMDYKVAPGCSLKVIKRQRAHGHTYKMQIIQIISLLSPFLPLQNHKCAHIKPQEELVSVRDLAGFNPHPFRCCAGTGAP